ncbi:hypothetical protein pb186bvf_002470 [Paramecium bursaria]
MISKIKDLVSPSPVTIALKDLYFYSNDQQMSTQQQISRRLKPFFTSQINKVQFLEQLIQILSNILEIEGMYFQKIKILILAHIIISSQTARNEFSKFLLSSTIDINLKQEDYSSQQYLLLCQKYFCYIYKLAANTTLISEDVQKPQDDYMIYFTLANQCYSGLQLQPLMESIKPQCPLIANIVKFLYQDLQDIYTFILKDVKYLISRDQTREKQREQLQELYKECYTLQDKLLDFYKFNRSFPHYGNIMPPQSILFKCNLQTEGNQQRTKEIPKTTKHSMAKVIQFHSRPLSPKNENLQTTQNHFM